MARAFLRTLVLCVSVLEVLSSGVFELRIDSFSSARGLCPPQAPRDCHVFFRVCLKHSQDVISAEPPCTYGTALTEILNTDDSKSISDSATVRIPFLKWPGTFSLIIEAWNTESTSLESTENQNNLLSRLATHRRLAAGEDWSQDVDFRDQSELRYSYHALCDEHYHGEACAAYCRPRDDTFGHYTCDAQGERRCLDGWSGEYCAMPICAAGCSANGICESPGKCVCRQGWEGERCDQCARHPGCVNGTCQQPWQCNCKEGWGGLYCDQDLNYCTNHRPCQNQAACTNTGQGSYTCTCRPGFTGTDCEIEINECDSNPCKSGGSCTDLVNDYSCSCPQGFYGKNCQTSDMRCDDKPCFNRGTCVENPGRGYTCLCPAGFTGSNCEKTVGKCSSSPCANGAQCVELGHRLVCRCRPGFTGPRCETNVDDCASNPCRNAGTCIDGVNDFTCLCTLGFTGKECGVRASPCDRFPCDNGGTCYAHISGPVCQCPTGFMGARCEYSVRSPAATKPPGKEAASSPALIAAVALGLVTLTLLLGAAVHILRQLRRRRELISPSVKNDLEAINNRNAVIGGGGGANNGGLPGAPLDAFLKVSNKDAALVEKGGDNVAMFKNKMADCNLANEEQLLSRNKFDIKKCDSSIIIPPLSFTKDGLYRPVFIIPEQMEQCVFATEV